MLVPQGMAYAMIAGLPPVYGLYAALFPQIVYAIMGTSRHLAVGPVAMDSLLVAAGIGALSVTDPSQHIALAIFLAFYVGVVQLILGGLKLGFLINFLSKPVISGFTSAAAIIIGFNQLHHLLGMQISQGNSFFALFLNIIKSLPLAHLPTLTVGLTSVVALLFGKRFFSKLPNALLLVIGATLLSSTMNWEAEGIAIVQDIPGGFPKFDLPTVSLTQIYALTPLAITLSLIAFLEAISIAKAIEEKEKKNELKPNQELIALGMANIMGSFFQAYPTTGGFSRTAVNYDAGAKSGFSALFSAAVIGLTLLFFTSFFYHLPNSILGAIILVAVINLVDLDYAKTLFKNNRQEFYILLFTFFMTLFVGIKEGILLGVFVALLFMIYQNTQPHIAVLGRISNTHYFKNIDRFSEEVITYPRVLILRFDGPLFFGNQGYFKSRINTLIKEQKQPINHLVIAAAPISYIDATAMQMLQQWMEHLNTKGVNVYWTGLNGPLRDRVYALELTNQLDKLFFFSSLDAALNAIQGKAPTAIEESIANQRNKS